MPSMLNDIYQSIDPIAFAVGPLAVRWYGVAYILGFICAGLVIWRTARRWSWPPSAVFPPGMLSI